jgi:hypothetical protein
MKKFQKLSKKRLINTCAEICYFAQSHSGDEDSWGPRNSPGLHHQMGHVSFVVSCLIAQNTRYGGDGVEWEVVLQELAGTVLDLKEWKKIIKNLVRDYGGSKYKKKLIEVKNA